MFFKKFIIVFNIPFLSYFFCTSLTRTRLFSNNFFARVCLVLGENVTNFLYESDSCSIVKWLIRFLYFNLIEAGRRVQWRKISKPLSKSKIMSIRGMGYLSIIVTLLSGVKSMKILSFDLV
jgi:hypothetical protein